MGILKASFASLLMLMLTACAGLQSLEDSALPRAAVQYGTIKFIQSDDDRMAERAAEVRRIAGDIREDFTDTPTTTIDNLYARVQKEVPYDKLDAADALLLNALMEELVAYLKEKVGDGVLSPDQRLYIDEVLQWIEQAALLASG